MCLQLFVGRDVLILYNICHRFSVRSKWPRVVWQAVTLWLVNRTARSGHSGTTGRRPCDENHAVRFRQSAEDAVERRTGSRSEASLTSLQWGASVGTHWLPGEDMGRRSPLSEYMSLHPSITHHLNINSFANKVWDIYIL